MRAELERSPALYLGPLLLFCVLLVGSYSDTKLIYALSYVMSLWPSVKLFVLKTTYLPHM